MQGRRAQESELDPRWACLYEEARGDLYRVAAYLLGDAEGEEVVQDAFIKAMHDARFFEDIREPRAWLRTTLVRLAVSRLRRRALWDRVRLLVRPSDPPERDPDLRSAIAKLPPNQRGAIVLRYYFGADTREIARSLALAESSVPTLLTRARAALAKELG